MEGWTTEMDENTRAKFEEKLKEILNVAKKKKNVLEAGFVNDYFKGINSFKYVDAYHSINKEYVETVLDEVFDFKNMVLSKVVPMESNSL